MLDRALLSVGCSKNNSPFFASRAYCCACTLFGHGQEGSVEDDDSDFNTFQGNSDGDEDGGDNDDKQEDGEEEEKKREEEGREEGDDENTKLYHERSDSLVGRAPLTAVGSVCV